MVFFIHLHGYTKVYGTYSFVNTYLYVGGLHILYIQVITIKAKVGYLLIHTLVNFINFLYKFYIFVFRHFFLFNLFFLFKFKLKK